MGRTASWTLAAMLLSGATNATAADRAAPVDLERLKPLPSATGIEVGGAQLLPQGELGSVLLLQYEDAPLALYNKETGERTRTLVDSRLVFHAGVAFGVLDRLEVGATMPFVLSQAAQLDGNGIKGVPTAPAGSGLADPTLLARGRLLDFAEHGMDLALQGALTAPISGGSDLLGEPHATFAPTVEIGRPFEGGHRFGLDVGYRFKEDRKDWLDLPVGDEIALGAGGVYALPEGFEALGEVGGSVLASDPVGQRANSAFELLLAARKWLGDFNVTLGGAAGLSQGYGTPAFRLFLAGAYRRHAEDPDPDKDGILGDADACSHDAEDFDQFEDTDGCPDPDNDKDGFADAKDKCPVDPEDVDKFQDEDGCPDKDNDEDGIVDAQDGCRDAAEDKDGYQDEDGCPDADNDGDGIVDGSDACRDLAEDMDKWQDEDGCPDPDNDGDGFTDLRDQCPDVAEVVNGFKDDDGCPDEGKTLVRVTEEKIEILDKVFFATGSDKILPKSFGLLDQIATTLSIRTNLTKIRVEGHTDSVGSEQLNTKLSQRRAESVKAYLVKKGIKAERLDPKGFGPTKPIGDNKTPAGREQNRRVEFVIVETAAVGAAPAKSVAPPPAGTPAPLPVKIVPAAPATPAKAAPATPAKAAPATPAKAAAPATKEPALAPLPLPAPLPAKPPAPTPATTLK